MPLGAVTGGLLAHRFGLRAPYSIAGALRGVALVVALPALVGARHGHIAGSHSR
jgi:predicted MFS family arabinose efflux permease